MAVVDGRSQIRDWTDKAGNKRTTAEVVADNVYFADSNKTDAAAPSAPSVSAALPVYDGHSEFAEVGADDGELPF